MDSQSERPMTSTSDEAFRKHIASFDNMAVAIEWKRRYEAHDSLVKALERLIGAAEVSNCDSTRIDEARAALSGVK